MFFLLCCLDIYVFSVLDDSDSRASAPDSPCDPHTAERTWSLALVCVAPRNRSTLLANHLPSFKGPHVFHSGKGLFWLHWMCRRTRGTEGSFMHQSHKQITNYATEPLKVLPFCFSIRGALSVAWGAWGENGEALCWQHIKCRNQATQRQTVPRPCCQSKFLL